MRSESYSDCLHFLPEKERKAAEKTLYVEGDSESLAMGIVRQMNRPLENRLETFVNGSKRLERF